MAEVKPLRIGATTPVSQFDTSDSIPVANGGVPAGGSTNQVLAKTSGSDFAVAWATPSAGGTSVIRPSQITSDQDNYSPTGWSTATLVLLSGDNGIRAITSFAAGSDGQEKKLLNIGSYPLYIPGEHPDGTAANRVISDRDYLLFPGSGVTVIYDGTLSRWLLLGQPRNVIDGRNMFYSWAVGSLTAGDYGDWTTLAINSGTISSATGGTSTLPGYAQISTFTTNNGGGAVVFAKLVGSYSYFSSAHNYLRTLLHIPTLSTGGETFTAEAQITNNVNSTSITPNNTIGIRYTHGTNSGKWQGFSRDNAGAESVVDLGVTVNAGQAYFLSIEIDKGRSEARFYVDGIMCGRVTGNMPNAVSCGSRVIMLKSVGSTARTLNIHNMSAGAIYP